MNEDQLTDITRMLNEISSTIKVTTKDALAKKNEAVDTLKDLAITNYKNDKYMGGRTQ